jgi:hypothetical protein
MAGTTKFRDDTAESFCLLSLSFVSVSTFFPASHSPGLSPFAVYIPSESTGGPSHSTSPVCHFVFYSIMVALDLILRISTIFLALDTTLASHQTLVRRAVDGLHLEAARRTHSLAKDLRVAFGGILPRAVSSSQHVVYCKPARQVPLGSNGGSARNGTSISMSNIGTRTPVATKGLPTSTQTSAGSSPTGTSSWRLIDSHVRMPFIEYLFHPDIHPILQSGSNFFDGWDFFTGADPTHGSCHLSVIDKPIF